MNKEIWRDIVGYEGQYQVSKLGNVRSLKYDKIRVLKLKLRKDGYYHVQLCNKCICNHYLINILVAKAFPEICGTWWEGCDVDHLDGNRTNNVAWNLKCKSHIGNINNEITIKRLSEARKGNKYAAKSVIQLSLNNEFIAKYNSMAEAEKETGANRTQIGYVCNKKPRYKTAGGFKWEFA